MAKNVRRYKWWLIGTVMACTLGCIVTSFGHFNPIFGTYTYDPRRDGSPAILMYNSPEPYVVSYFQNKFAQEGSYPVGNPRKITSIEATETTASVYTDWQTGMETKMLLHYDDNSTHTITFKYHSFGSAEGWFGVSVQAQFNDQMFRIVHCDEPDVWYIL